MKLLKALALAITLALLPSVASAATPTSARYGTGTFTVGNVQLPGAYGCFYHPYTVNLSLGYETTDWYLDVRITAPNGTVVDEAYASEWDTSGGSRTLTGEIFFCSSQTAAGIYSMTGVLNTYEGSSDYTATAQSLTPAQFQVSPYVAPTPTPTPTPTPIPTPVVAPVVTAPPTADVVGSVSSSSITRGVKLVFKTKALPAGSVVGNKVIWTVLLDGKIRKTFSQWASAKQAVKVTSPARSGAHVVKVLRNGKSVKTVRYRA